MSSSFDDLVADPVHLSDDGFVVEDSPILVTEEEQILFPLSEMQPEEGFALIEWRRENALHLEEKEKIEKELLNQIIDEVDDYKIKFHNR
ncbi:unnamed protein product [Lactuca saligna]|uniref:Uncharacterized protein n=1 Tax=Lactuca saligna TaxID=75948 RepID=A0AA35VDP4_LACSI|nr:unnamed protein product [Lactuca saligna]